MTLDEISIILVYSAMAVYALAFIAYAIDLARRSAVAAKAADDAKAASVEASGTKAADAARSKKPCIDPSPEAAPGGASIDRAYTRTLYTCLYKFAEAGS